MVKSEEWRQNKILAHNIKRLGVLCDFVVKMDCPKSDVRCPRYGNEPRVSSLESRTSITNYDHDYDDDYDDDDDDDYERSISRSER